MTEKVVLEKLEFFKEAIQNLKEKISSQEIFIQQSNEYMQKHNEQDFFDTMVQENMQAHIEDLEKEIESLELKQKEITQLYEEEKEKNTVLETSVNNWKERFEEAQKEINTDKKYTEEDLKTLLKKASAKAKEDLNAWETQYNDLQIKYQNLELTNKSLERELEKKNINEEIDQVLEGKITEKEIDEILSEKY